MVNKQQAGLLVAVVLAAVGFSAWYRGKEPVDTSAEGDGQPSSSAAHVAPVAPPATGSLPAVFPSNAVAEGRESQHAAFLDQIILSTQFEELLDRARREPSFAFALASALHHCSEEGKQRSDAERLRASNKVHAEQRLLVLEKRYAKCAGLDESQIAFQYELMAAAARAGIYEAQLDYREVVREAMRSGYAARNPNVMDEMRTNYEAFTLAAARTGQPEALYRAFSMYDNGRLVVQNPVQAYKYLEMYSRASRNMDPEKVKQVQEQLARLEAGMTEEQRRQARQN